MGLTHYWQREPELSEYVFQSAVGDLQKLFSNIDIKLAGKNGEGIPLLSLDEITFNGIQGQNCEDFTVRRVEIPRRGRSTVFSYCKTEHMPYDLCVKCTLIVLKHCFDDRIIINSDDKNEDWTDACKLCQKHLGYGADFRLSQ